MGKKNKNKALALVSDALREIEKEIEGGELPSGVKLSHLRILEKDLQDARGQIMNGNFKSIFKYGDNRKLIADMWPLDYQLADDILGAYQAADSLKA